MRAALYKCRTETPTDVAEEARLMALLANDRAFDSPGVLNETVAALGLQSHVGFVSDGQ